MLYIRRYRHWIVSILFFASLLVGSVRYANFKKGQWEKDIRNQTLEMLVSKKSSLEKALYSRIYYTRGVAAFVSLKPQITNEEFGRLAKEFIKNDSVISTMSLSRNCVINAIYPEAGHETALGLDLLAHPQRKEIVDKTIETHETFVAGPVQLVEGGIAFISYTPIFDTSNDTLGVFWGLTDIVIKRDALFYEANILPLFRNFEFALRGYDGKGNDGDVFWGDPRVFNNDPVTINIELPHGNWVMAAVPQAGWSFYYDQDVVLTSILIISSVIISILLLVLLKAGSRIRHDAREFKAIFSSLDTLIVELSDKGEYLKVAPTNLNLLVRSQEEIVGKKINDIFEPALAKLFMDAIGKCLSTHKVVVIDYPLEIKGEALWFVARVSYKTERSVIYNAYDVTNIKNAEIKLQESEEHLGKLNKIKDRFFSIVAHDLRNPVGSFRNITDLLLDQSVEKTPTEVNKLIKSLNDTSVGLNDLLENLLSWTMAQQNQIEINLMSQSIHQLCESVIASQITHALVKKIEIQNNIDTDHYALVDESLSNIILRNLISNAIKFSNPSSKILLSSELSKIDGEEFVLLHVRDFGVGISEDKKDNIFSNENKYQTHGTSNEKGSGLGLVLCKEFTELQGGKIWVNSKLGEGSTFTISLPI